MSCCAILAQNRGVCLQTSGFRHVGAMLAVACRRKPDAALTPWEIHGVLAKWLDGRHSNDLWAHIGKLETQVTTKTAPSVPFIFFIYITMLHFVFPECQHFIYRGIGSGRALGFVFRTC